MMKDMPYDSERQAAAGQFLREGEYWLRKLSGEAGESIFPPDFPGSSRNESDIKSLKFALPVEMQPALMKLSNRSDTRLFMILAAGLVITLHKYTGSRDIIIGSPIFRQETEGDFINTVLPLRSRLAKDITFKQLLLQVRQTVIEAEENQNYPMTTLLYKLGIPYTGERFPLFDTAILLENIHDKAYIQHTNPAILFSFNREGSRVGLTVDYYASLYRQGGSATPADRALLPNSSIERIVHHFTHLLQQALDDVDAQISNLDLLSPREKNQVLVEFNDTARPYPLDKTLHELFEEQAARTPENTAIYAPGRQGGAFRENCPPAPPAKAFDNKKQRTTATQNLASQPEEKERRGEPCVRPLINSNPVVGARRAVPELNSGQTLTYRQLNDKANRLARLLRQQGVSTGSIVGLMQENPGDVVTGILAIMKAGGAYLPMDKKMPDKRAAAILKDSRACHLLTASTVLKEHSFTALQGLQDRGVEVKHTPARKQVVTLDDLPIPNRSLVDYEKYNRYIGQVMVKNIISLQTARGCPYNCYYCSKVWGRKHVFRTAGSIFNELKMYYDMGFRRFSIFDDIFNVHAENGMQLFEKIIQHNLDLQLFFPNGLRGDLLSKDYIDLLAAAGLAATALALETASPRLQKLIGKNLNLDKFRENVTYICEKYPHVILELFTMHGFPTETEEEARLTMEFIKEQKWLHFPYVFILKIYPGTEMANLAMEHGVLREDILKCEDLAFHELSPTSPFKQSFTRNYQAEFLNEYFLDKERLRHVLPYQAKVLTEDEMIRKYDSYLPYNIKSFADILELAGITKEESGIENFLPEDSFTVPGLNRRLRQAFPPQKPEQDALKVLILDLSQYFTGDTAMLYDVVEPPLGAMYVMTYLQEKLGSKIKGLILKSRIDFDSLDELKTRLQDFRPDVIGARSLTFYRDFFHKILAAVRQWGIDVPVIAGGPYATRSTDTMLQDRNIDIAVISEGETTFCEIIEKMIAHNGKLPGQEILAKINGIAYVTNGGQLEREAARQIVLLDQAEFLLSRQPAGNVNDAAQPHHPAYIMYTSGSTGIPKGVVVEHRSVVNVVQGFIEAYNLAEKDRVIQLTNYTFDPSVEQVFSTLHCGALLVAPPKEIISDAEEFIRCMEETGVTIINYVPAVLKELLGESERARLRSLRAVISGGEKLDDALKDRLIAAGFELYNQYGPTETTVDALRGKCSPGEKVDLGTPIPNACCFILSKNMELLPAAVPGELYIGGAGVARGYLNRPELTSELFIDNKSFCGGCRGAVFTKSAPLLAEGNRLYKTGDLCRWLPGGRIEFLGRRDHQVKIRGFRIELGEIESRILKHKKVKEAVVLDRKSPQGDGYLCAYVVPRTDGAGAEEPLTLTELRDFLGVDLPDYMIPLNFISLDKLPLNPNGKVDYKTLKEYRGGDLESGAGYVAPKNEVEEILVDVWQQVLEKEKIGTTENFFMIGGDSIKSIQITTRINKAGYRLKMNDLFRYPVIADLAPFVEKIHRTPDQVPVQGVVPLTPIQAEFFRDERIAPHHFNQAVMLYSPAGFAEEAVRAVFAKIREHHDALRLTYRRETGRIIQTNHGPDLPLSLTICDLKHKAGTEASAAELHSKANEIQAGINLEKGPLMKLGLFHLDDGDRLLIVCHHLVIDGVSWRILFEDIANLYRQHLEGKPLSLPLKTDSFKTWSEGLSAYAKSKSLLAEKAYWAELESTPVPGIRKDFAAEDNPVKDSLSLSVSLDEEETQRLLTEVNEAFATDINDILVTALGLSFAGVYGCEKILVALEGHGREEILPHIDISRTVGCFTTVYPLILDLSYRNDLSRQIKVIKESLHRVPNKGIGRGILKHLAPEEHKKDIAFKLKPRIRFNYSGQFDKEVEQMPFNAAAEAAGNSFNRDEQRAYELDVTGMIRSKKLVMSMVFGKKQFKTETIKEIMDTYKAELVRIIAFCAGREEKEVTPSDMTYKELSIDQVEAIDAMFRT